MLAVGADALALPVTYENFAAHEATAALPCALAVGFRFFVRVRRVNHHSSYMQREHPIDPIFLGQRFHSFGEGGEVGSAGQGFWIGDERLVPLGWRFR